MVLLFSLAKAIPAKYEALFIAVQNRKINEKNFTVCIIVSLFMKTFLRCGNSYEPRGNLSEVVNKPKLKRLWNKIQGT